MALPNLRFIRERAELIRDLRAFFDQRAFLEVQPPCLSSDCVVDAYIDPIEVKSAQFRVAKELPETFFLQTSPEAAMKRMLAAGAPSIYSIGPVFRSGESGDLHNIEFTMLEWYEVGGNGETAMQCLGELVSNILGMPGFDIVTYRDLFLSELGFDPIDCEPDVLLNAAERCDGVIPETMANDRDDLLDWLLTELIQPKLGFDRALIMRDYPITQAALARQSTDDPECAARFELFARGIELANGYDELLDAEILKARTEIQNQKRISTGRRPLEINSPLHSAMQSGLPACAGVALGVDRLLMLRTNSENLREVLPFPIDIS